MSQPKATCRELRPSDLDLMLRLQHMCFPWSRGDGSAASVHAIANMPPAQRRADRSFMRVVEVGDRFAGFALAQPQVAWTGQGQVLNRDASLAIVSQVAIVPNYRGRGLGTALVRDLTTQLTPANFSVALAHIKDDHVNWYKHMGWEVFDRGQGFAWLDKPTALNDGLFPSLPRHVRAELSAVSLQVPMGEDGYDRLALKRLGSAKLLATSQFAAVQNQHEDARGAARALDKAVKSSLGLRQSLSRPTRELLAFTAMTPEEQVAWNAEKSIEHRISGR